MKLSKINKNSAIILIIVLIFFNLNLFAKGTAGTNATLETRYIVDMPTAGVLPKKNYNVRSIFFSDGGVAVYTLFAPFNNFNIGLSYSGTNIIGGHDIAMQNLPGIQASYRIVNEKLYFPALAVGFNSQGFGRYFKSVERFETYSPGAYIALSKNFEWAGGYLATHGGVGYSLEPKSKDRLPNFWIGLEQSLGPWAALNLEYNANIDEPNNGFYENHALLNASIRVAITNNATLELQIRDLLDKSKVAEPYQRIFSIDYIGSF